MKKLKVLVRGAGEMASGVGVSLFRAHIHAVFTEIPTPLCVRRGVAFCEALYQGRMSVEGCPAVLVAEPGEIEGAWLNGQMAVLVDPDLASIKDIAPDVLVDAILAKRNLGLTKELAELVIALGPGFVAGVDAHVVIETNRGHDLGRLIFEGQAQPDTGIPGPIGGEDARRVLRAPADGFFESFLEIGQEVSSGQVIGQVAGRPVLSQINGVLRGLIRPGTSVEKGLKIGDVDPRGCREYCWTVSDKSRAIGRAVLEAICHHFNRS